MNTVLKFLNPRRLAPFEPPFSRDPDQYTVDNEGTQTTLIEPVVVLAYSDPETPVNGDSVTLLKDWNGDGRIGLQDIEASMAALKKLTANDSGVTGRELAQQGFRPAIVHPRTHDMPLRFPSVQVGSATADADGNPALRFVDAAGHGFEISELRGFGEAIRVTVNPLPSPARWVEPDPNAFNFDMPHD